jgi:putative membrane protein
MTPTLMNLAVLADQGSRWDDGPPWPVFPFFLLIVGALVTFAVLWTRRSRASTSATAIVAERYARGEIDHDEYRERLAHLTEKRR